MPKQRVTITLPPDLWAKTQQMARERHLSASAYVARALQEMLPRDRREARLTAALELVTCRLPEEPDTDVDAGIDDYYDECFDDTGVI